MSIIGIKQGAETTVEINLRNENKVLIIDPNLKRGKNNSCVIDFGN